MKRLRQPLSRPGVAWRALALVYFVATAARTRGVAWMILVGAAVYGFWNVLNGLTTARTAAVPSTSATESNPVAQWSSSGDDH